MKIIQTKTTIEATELMYERFFFTKVFLQFTFQMLNLSSSKQCFNSSHSLTWTGRYNILEQ